MSVSADGVILDWCWNWLLSQQPDALIVIQDAGGPGGGNREETSGLEPLLKDLRLGRVIAQWVHFCQDSSVRNVCIS